MPELGSKTQNPVFRVHAAMFMNRGNWLCPASSSGLDTQAVLLFELHKVLFPYRELSEPTQTVLRQERALEIASVVNVYTGSVVG